MEMFGYSGLKIISLSLSSLSFFFLFNCYLIGLGFSLEEFQTMQTVSFTNQVKWILHWCLDIFRLLLAIIQWKKPEKGLKLYLFHFTDILLISVWKLSVLNSSLIWKALQVSLHPSLAVKADPVMPQRRGWPWHLVLGVPLLPTWSVGWAERSGIWWTEGCQRGKCMPVYGGCHMPAFYLDGLWTSLIDYRNKKQKALVSCLYVCVCLHYDNCFAWPLFHYSESLSAVGVSKIQKQKMKLQHL